MSKIQFSQIGNAVRKPGVYTEYNSQNAVTALPVNPQEVLIIAPQSVEAEIQLQRVFSDVEASKIFGQGSLAHLMTRVAMLNNPTIRLSVLGVPDHNAGVAALGKITLSGTASSAGVLSAVISGEKYEVSVAKGETANALAQRLSAVINAGAYSPVVATLENSVVKLTAKAKGEIGNELQLSATCSAPEVSFEVSAFTGGQRNADITTALTRVAGFHFNLIISAFSDVENAQALRLHLEAMASPIEKKPAIGVLGWRGTMAAGTTFTSRLNHERLTVAWYKGAVEPNALLAAGYGAVIASEEDPARPLNTLEVKGLQEVSTVDIPTFSEFDQALYHGLTPLEVVNHRVQIMRAISTYTKSAANTDDPAYLDLTTIRTLDYVRKAVEQRLSLRFPREKLHDRTAVKVKSEILDVLYRLEEAEIVEKVDEHKGKLLVVRNGQDVNRLDTVIPADVVNGLHIVANRIDLIL